MSVERTLFLLFCTIRPDGTAFYAVLSMCPLWEYIMCVDFKLGLRDVEPFARQRR